jgi:hypothetical protein
MEVVGDFTTSGGLLGTTGLYCNTIYNAQFAYASGQNPSTGAGANATIECWVKPDVNTYQVIARSSGPGVWMFLNDGLNNGTDKLRFDFADSGSVTNTLYGPNNTLTENRWNHVAGVISGTSQKMYIDGKLVAEQTMSNAGVKTGTGGWALGSNPGASEYEFDGHIHMFRMWDEARDITGSNGIRANMFNTTPTDSNTKLVANINFVAGGSGGTVTDAAGNGNGTLYKDDGGHSTTTDAAAWAVAGTFNYDTSELKFTGSSNTLTFLRDPLRNTTNNGLLIGKLSVDDTAVTLKSIDNNSGIIKLRGNFNFTDGATGTLSSDGQEKIELDETWRTLTTNGIQFHAGGKDTCIANLDQLKLTNSSGTISLPSCTTKQLDIRNAGTKQLTGDVKTTVRTLPNSNAIFDFNGFTLDTIRYNAASHAKTYFSGGLLKDTVGGGAGFMFDDGTLLWDAGTITGHSGKTNLRVGENWELVGNISNCELTTDSESPTIVGTTTNCSAAVPANNKFIQWHHTLDTQQLLDADQNDDDDMKLPRPSLDNSHTMQTGG